MDDGLLRTQRKILNNAAIEMGQRGKAREDAEKAEASSKELMRMIEAGRQRVAKRRERDEAENQRKTAKDKTHPDDALGKSDTARGPVA